MGRPKKNKDITTIEESTDTRKEEIPYAAFTGLSLSRDNVKIEVTEEDKENFYKCFISDQRFQDESSLFDGKIKVTFKTITVSENNDILKQLNLDTKIGLISTNEQYLLVMNIYRFAMGLKAIDGIKFDTTDITKDKFVISEDEPNTTYVKAKADKFKDWDTFKLAAFITVYSEFERKVFELEKSVADPNFWKAAV